MVFCNKGILLFLILCWSFSVSRVNSGKEKALSRRKRYIVFPEGSSFSIALCLTIHTLTPDNIFTEGVNWGISYDLPNESKPALEPFLELRNDKFKTKPYVHKEVAGLKNHAISTGAWNYDGNYYVLPNKKKYYKSSYYYLQRRHRRDLYNKLEVIMNAMGFDGRTCILRALCEASQTLMPRGNTLVEELIRIAFSLPLKRVFSFEPEEHRIYTDAHKAGHEGRNCVAMFPGCSFSLLDMALGKYNTPDYQRSSYNPDASDLVDGTLDTRSSADVRYSMK